MVDSCEKLLARRDYVSQLSCRAISALYVGVVGVPGRDEVLMSLPTQSGVILEHKKMGVAVSRGWSILA